MGSAGTRERPQPAPHASSAGEAPSTDRATSAPAWPRGAWRRPPQQTRLRFPAAFSAPGLITLGPSGARPAPRAAPHLLALIRVLVRVVLESQLPIGLLDLLRGRAGLHAQDVIVLGLLHHLVSAGGRARPVRVPRTPLPGPWPASPPPARASRSRSPLPPPSPPPVAPARSPRWADFHARHRRTRATGSSAAGFIRRRRKLPQGDSDATKG